MKASFQILTQPWIPVKELDGSMKELSLLETLERAHLLSEIQDPSPMRGNLIGILSSAMCASVNRRG